MPITYTITEKPDSRPISISRDGVTATRIFKVESDDVTQQQILLDPEAVYNAGVLASLGDAHPTITGIILKSIDLKVLEDAKNRGIITYTYGRPDTGGNQGGGRSTPNENGEIWTFNLVSQSTTINMVKNDSAGNPQQKTYDGKHTTGAQLHSALNYDDESVQGVEVYRPMETVSVSKVYPDYTDVNQTYRNTIRSLQNTINDAQWPASGYLAKTLLFLGADISYNLAEGSATVNYSFMAGKIQGPQEFTVWASEATNDLQTVVAKVARVYPFQVVWAPLDRRALPEVAGQKSKPVYHLKSINVADVYDFGDFSELKIVGE